MKPILFIICLLVIYSSCSRSLPGRDKIVFNVDLNSFQDSLIKTQSFLKRLPEAKNLNLNFYYQSDSLYIDNQKVQGNINLDTVSVLSNLNKTERRSFLKLCSFLKDNYITAGFYDRSVGGLWLFNYRELPDASFTETREITLFQNNLSTINQEFKVLDHKNDIYLLMPNSKR